jgi:hypothetical protein
VHLYGLSSARLEAAPFQSALFGTLRLRSGQASEAVPFPINVKVKVRIKTQIKIKIKVRGVGQECPTHTGNVRSGGLRDQGPSLRSG